MECSPIPLIPYHKFSRQIHNKVIAARIPIEGSIELTLRCNLKCLHCYVVYDPSQEEMACEQICRILNETTEAGCLWLTITGGEILIRNDFLDIYSYAKKCGLIVTLLTNGTLITPQIADYLRKWPPFAVEITLNGITKETYEKVTGVSGSFERCIRGIQLLLERNIPLRLKTTVTALNKHELWKIKKYAEKLGVEFRFDPLLHPRLDGSRQPNKLRISPREVLELDLADEKRSQEMRKFCKSKFWGLAKTDKLYFCGAGLTSFHIDPYGKLNFCMMSRAFKYNLSRGTFKDAWYDFIPKIQKQKSRDGYKCKTCDLLSLCGQCPGWSQLENGDLETPVEYLCQIAHLRAKVFRVEEELVKKS